MTEESRLQLHELPAGTLIRFHQYVGIFCLVETVQNFFSHNSFYTTKFLNSDGVFVVPYVNYYEENSKHAVGRFSTENGMHVIWEVV